MIEKNIKELEIKFVGSHDWELMRNLLILKLMDCKEEKDFVFVIEALLGSMFKDEKEMDEQRKRMNLKLLDEHEKKRIREFIKNGNRD